MKYLICLLAICLSINYSYAGDCYRQNVQRVVVQEEVLYPVYEVQQVYAHFNAAPVELVQYPQNVVVEEVKVVKQRNQPIRQFVQRIRAPRVVQKQVVQKQVVVKQERVVQRQRVVGGY